MIDLVQVFIVFLHSNHGVQDTMCQESELEGHNVSITVSTGGRVGECTKD